MAIISGNNKMVYNNGSNCDLGCKYAKDLFFGKIYCKKYGWIIKNVNCKSYKPKK